MKLFQSAVEGVSAVQLAGGDGKPVTNFDIVAVQDVASETVASQVKVGNTPNEGIVNFAPLARQLSAHVASTFVQS
jgi:hypothetical protein